MLSRYKIYDRRKRPAEDQKPIGETRDIRYRSNHILAPVQEIVRCYAANPTESAWHVFADKYLRLLETQFRTSREEFDELAFSAMMYDYYIGCSCPTSTNYKVARCHTELALTFMKRKYPELTTKHPRLKAWLYIQKRGRRERSKF